VTEFPSATDYQQALQNPTLAFTHPGLQQAIFTRDSWGLPEPVTGSSAAVFQGTIGADCYALRCYTRADASSRERYEALDRYVAAHGLTDYVANVSWFEDAVQVRRATWPVLRMEWIEGRILDEYVGYLVKKRNIAALGMLAAQWRKLVKTLQDAQFAHGDLQHRNVLVDQGARLRLVDFDSVWMPTLDGQSPPTESGHDNFQHPRRKGTSGWGRWTDTFSGLVIYLSLLALASDPGIWLPLNTGENLLFEKKDFLPPFETDAWKHVFNVPDPEVTRLARKLRECCAPGWEASQSLEDTIAPTWWQGSGGAAATATAPAGSPPGSSAPEAPAWRYVSTQGGAPGAPVAGLPPPPSTETFTGAASFQGPGASEGIRLPSGAASGPARQAASGSGSRQGKWWESTVPPPRPARPAAPAVRGIVAANPHWAMAVWTIILCWPLGIFAIISAAQVKPSVASGNLAAAQKASSRVKVIFWISVVLWLIIIGIVAAANASGPSYQ
jgi:eukaryotic-like serine/threonine-protein kinase